MSKEKKPAGGKSQEAIKEQENADAARDEAAKLVGGEGATASGETAAGEEATTVDVADAEPPTGKQRQDDALRSTGMRLPEDTRVYQVEIENCLLGRKFVLAHSEAEAIEKYKKPCGITSHAGAATASVTELDPANLPEGVELFGEPAAQG